MEPVLPTRRPKRADARRNFDVLVAAAREAFAESGAQPSLEDIARRAGVSIATLYRNFPSREDLVEEVHREEVVALCRAAGTVADLEPWDALATWLHRFVEYIGTKLAFADALNRTTDGFQACRKAMREAGGPLLERAQRAGAARPELSIDDILRMISGVSTVEYVDDAQRERVLAVTLDAVRLR
ncbi:TetR/AcrR family transcriptional regulator [Amycolatopsis oliviviridis]|uniref:TetR family transcriptional regulator n=1 Tax=Amycolatopsis oliviviridis TaxID=1471590 RepID=A0ABQ3L549_9PSEU|nr:TetR/AcrR family transcriptional regulator [Amycolatopsis oliviviridis]GHH03085.1 TetR family transcriptional regulator [Amycolatopsis oliviviridis]